MGEKVIVDDEVTYTNNSSNFNTGFQPALLDGFLEGLPEAAPTMRKAPVGIKEEVVEETVTEKAGKAGGSIATSVAESLTEAPVEFEPIKMSEWDVTEEEFMDGRMNLETRFPGFEFMESGPGRDKISVKAPGATKFKEFAMGNNFQKGTNATSGINEYIKKHMNKSSSKQDSSKSKGY
jgi:hypothetical protein